MLKAISLWQPWASLIMVKAKIYETRSWSTNYRGPLVICCAKASNPEILKFISDYQLALMEVFNPDDRRPVTIDYFARGAALGVVDLTNCISTNNTGFIESIDPEHGWGDFSPNRFAWKLENVRPFPWAIPTRGRQGLFTPDDRVTRAAMQVIGGSEGKGGGS